MRILSCLLLLILFAVPAVADNNVAGKWTGSFHSTGQDGEARESTAVLLLKQNGSDVTGTVGPNENEQNLVLKGKIDGDRITLLAEDEGRSLHFDLVLAGDRISGEVNMVHKGGTAKAKLEVTRAK